MRTYDLRASGRIRPNREWSQGEETKQKNKRRPLQKKKKTPPKTKKTQTDVRAMIGHPPTPLANLKKKSLGFPEVAK